MSEKPRFRTLFQTVNMLKDPKRLWNLYDCTLTNFFDISGGTLNWKMPLLAMCEILGVFANTLTADGTYFLCNSQNLPQLTETKVSKKQKSFLDFLLLFWNLHSILILFLKKRYILIVYVLPKLRTGKDVVRQMSKKPLSEYPSTAYMLKGPKTLVKTAWQHFYHLFSSLWEKLT